MSYFRDQQEEWMNDNCKGNIEDYGPGDILGEIGPTVPAQKKKLTPSTIKYKVKDRRPKNCKARAYARESHNERRSSR